MKLILKFGIVIWFCLVVGDTSAQQGWNFDKPNVFSITDTTYFGKQNIQMFQISDSNEILVALNFDSTQTLKEIKLENKTFNFKHDSNGTVTMTLIKSDYSNQCKELYQKETKTRKVQNDTLLLTSTLSKVGRFINQTNKELNDLYQGQKYLHPKTGKKVKPLKKKLKVNYLDTNWYEVRTQINISTKDTSLVEIKFSEKGEAFELPKFLQPKDSVIAMDSINERMYHKRVFFNLDGRVDHFYFTDEPNKMYFIKYQYYADKRNNIISNW
jgi:hypothetical protein